jgi:hypothetical protein
VYWLRAYNTPENRRTFSLVDTDDSEQVLELSLKYLEKVADRDTHWFGF